jgi:hypothetical protein
LIESKLTVHPTDGRLPGNVDLTPQGCIMQALGTLCDAKIEVEANLYRARRGLELRWISNVASDDGARSGLEIGSTLEGVAASLLSRFKKLMKARALESGT